MEPKKAKKNPKTPAKKVATLLRIPQWLNTWLVAQTGAGKSDKRQDVILDILKREFNKENPQKA